MFLFGVSLFAFVSKNTHVLISVYNSNFPPPPPNWIFIPKSKSGYSSRPKQKVTPRTKKHQNRPPLPSMDFPLLFSEVNFLLWSKEIITFYLGVKKADSGRSQNLRSRDLRRGRGRSQISDLEIYAAAAGDLEISDLKIYAAAAGDLKSQISRSRDLPPPGDSSWFLRAGRDDPSF